MKTYLLPDRSKTAKRKTKTKKRATNPVFNEVRIENLPGFGINDLLASEGHTSSRIEHMTDVSSTSWAWALSPHRSGHRGYSLINSLKLALNAFTFIEFILV